MATLVATADPTTGTVRIDISQAQLVDTFTRVLAASWGNATPSGQLWTNSGGAAADYSVNGTQGLHTVNTTIVGRHSTATISAGFDMGLQTFVTIPVLALTQPIQTNTMVRFISVANNYFSRISIAPGGVATLILGKQVLGVMTPLGSVVLGQTHAAGATWVNKIDVCGSRLRAKAWRNTVNEPGWMLEVNDFDLTTGTDGGVRSVLESGNTNGVVAFAYDNFFGFIGDGLRLYRVTPDGVRTEVRGSPFNTDTQSSGFATATFYDNEAPFDVDVFYELMSGCSSTVLATSNTVNLDSDGDGWLRDPVDPTLNLRIVMEEFFDECVDENVVVFSGLDAREYTNSSGVFDIVQAERPNTVSMIRKNYASVLSLTSFTLDDVDSLENINRNGRILLLSLPAAIPYGWATRSYGTDYITLFDVTQALIGVDQRVTSRVWVMPFRLSPEPRDTSEGQTGGNGLGVPGSTFNDLQASVIGTTFNSLTASGFTFLQIAQGTGY